MTLSVGGKAGARCQESAAGSNGTGYLRTVLAGFVVLAAGNAVGFYGLAVYLGGLESSGRFSLGLVSALTSVFFITSGLTSLLVGRGLAVLSVRAVLLVGAVVTGGGVWLVGHAAAPWQLLCAYVLLGGGMAATGPIPLTTALIRVAAASGRRNQAMAVMLSGMTAGGAVFVPVLATMVERYGLANATSVAAPLAVVGIVVPALLVAGGGPGSVARDESAPPAHARVPGAEGELPRRRSRRVFALLAATFAGFMGAQVGFNTQLYTIASEFDIPAAGGALGVVAGTGMAARIAGILLVRCVPSERFLAGMAVAQCLSPVVLLAFPDQTGLYVSAVLLGLAVGNGSVLAPILTLKIAGQDAYSRLVSRLSFVMTLGIASGPMVAGGVRAATGTYDVVLVGVSVLSLLAATSCLVVERAGAWLAPSRP